MENAIWAIIGVLTGSILSGYINYYLQTKRFEHEKAMFLLQNQATELVKQLLTEMLSHKSYTDRSFGALKKPIGGYSDDDIKRFLHEVGAKKSHRTDDEFWYLVSRKDERIQKIKDKNKNK